MKQGKKKLQCLSQKFHVLSCYDEHGTMALYDGNVSFTNNTIITNSSANLSPHFLMTTQEKH
jgi:hypothetical protein